MRWRLAGPADLREVGDALAAAPRIGLDTEFHAERRHLPQLYLVQVHLPDGAIWVLDPLDAATLETMASSLARPAWVVHGGQQDLRVLAPICGRPPAVYDTQVAAGLVGTRYPIGYAELLAARLGRNIDKGETLSDWSRRPLHPEQLAYAANDVEDLLVLWDALAADAGRAGRAGALADACGELAEQALAPAAPDWRRLAGAASLDARGAAALERLLAWREQSAALLDQPARQLVADPVLVDLARRLPKSRTALAANRRIGKSMIRDFGDEVLAAIHAALALPEHELPRVVRPGSPEAARVAILGAVAELLADAGRWAAGLVLPRTAIERLAIAGSPDRGAIAAAIGPWRDALAGEDLARFLSGERGVWWNAGSPLLR